MDFISYIDGNKLTLIWIVKKLLTSSLTVNAGSSVSIRNIIYGIYLYSMYAQYTHTHIPRVYIYSYVYIRIFKKLKKIKHLKEYWNEFTWRLYVTEVASTDDTNNISDFNYFQGKYLRIYFLGSFTTTDTSAH